MIRVDSEGRRTTVVDAGTATLMLSTFAADLPIVDKEGNSVLDKRGERLDQEKKLAKLIEEYQPKDATLRALLGSNKAAAEDPDKELVHLYEIRSALLKRFSEKKKDKDADDRACRAVSVKDREWDRLGNLANNRRQGRHRGAKVESLRDATKAELEEARRIASKMIEGYISFLECSEKTRTTS
jgi:hypothetical protein